MTLRNSLKKNHYSAMGSVIRKPSIFKKGKDFFKLRYERKKYARIIDWLEAKDLPTKTKGDRLENLVTKIFQIEGLIAYKTGGCNDRGIDLLVYKDKAWSAVQCKNVKRTVPPSHIRELKGVLHTRIPSIEACPKNVWLVTTSRISNNQKKVLQDLNSECENKIVCYDYNWIMSKIQQHTKQITKFTKLEK